MVAFGAESVTLVRRVVAGRDGDGNDVYGETEIPVDGVVVWPSDLNGSGGNEQDTARGDVVLRGLTVSVPSSLVVRSTDEFVARGVRWSVVGQPEPFQELEPGFPGEYPVTLQRVEG